MAVTIAGYNVGTDANFSITDQYGDIFVDSDLGYLMEFDSESEDVDLKITPITTGGVPVYQTLWNGMRGHMMFTRFGPTFQQMFMDLQSAYYGAGLIPQFTLQLSVRNRDTSIDEYVYTGLQFTRPRFGNFRSTKEVDMRVEFRAAQVAGTGALTAFLTGLQAA